MLSFTVGIVLKHESDISFNTCQTLGVVKTALLVSVLLIVHFHASSRTARQIIQI